MAQQLWKTVGQLLEKLKIEFLSDLAVLLASVYPGHGRMRAHMFTAAWFTRAKRGAPTPMSAGGWVQTVRCGHSGREDSV